MPFRTLEINNPAEIHVSSIRNRLTTSLQDPLKLPVLIPKEVVDAVKE